MQVSFHELQKHDLPQINRIYNWYIEHSTATFHTGHVSEDEMLEFLYIGHTRYKSFLIRWDDEVAGYCFLTAYKKRQAYDRTAEVTIYLSPDYCGKGIGRTALAYLEKVARDVNIRNLIGVISGNNFASIVLFEREGYLKCAHFKNVGEKFGEVLDVVAYQKELI